MPANVFECRSRSLEVHQIRQSDSGDRHTDTFRSDVIWEDLTVPDHTADVYSETIDRDEGIEGKDAEAEPDLVVAGVRTGGKSCDHCCFDYETDATAEDAEEHERFSSDLNTVNMEAGERRGEANVPCP